jgi:hypothetical protein
VTWTSALPDLRTLLSDNGTDKLAWKKRCVGAPNGTTKDFKTFDIRRTASFVGALYPIGVFVNDTLSVVALDDIESGSFQLATAPLEGARIEATYYHQWFTDTQLSSFLNSASNFLGLAGNVANITSGLQPAALKYAAADAYQELAVRYARMISESFRMEDLPKDSLKQVIDSYEKLAEAYREQSKQLRDDYYQKQGRQLNPAGSAVWGTARDPKPNR